MIIHLIRRRKQKKRKVLCQTNNSKRKKEVVSIEISDNPERTNRKQKKPDRKGEN